MERAHKESLAGVDDQVIAAITSGQAKMRPRWRFVMRTMLTATAGVIILLFLIYLASFIIFALHESGAWFVPVFGLGGWYAFFNALPLVLIFLVAVFIAILAFLMRRYPAAYHWPLVYSLLAIVFLIVGGGLVIAQTSLSQTLFSTGTGQGGVPFLGAWYGGLTVPDLGDVHEGRVVLIMPNGFVIASFRGTTSTVMIVTSTSLLYGSAFSPGDVVVVFGDRGEDGIIRAIGIERLSSTVE
jgi:hypothetical protein